MNQSGSFDYLRLCSVLASGAIMLQILLGAMTRLTGSGLACPDWPLCYGLWFPTTSALAMMSGVDYSFGQVMLEWGHRFNAAVVVAPLVLSVFLLAYRGRRCQPLFWKIGVAMVAILIIQSGVGGFTVFDHNSPWSVSIHLSLALILLAFGVSLVRLKIYSTFKNVECISTSWIFAVLALLVLVTMVSGAIVAKTGATLACSGWPLCNGQIIPVIQETEIALHLSHRILALLTFLSLIWFSYQLHVFRYIAPLIVSQVMIGAFVILVYQGNSFLFQVAIGIVHQMIGVAIFVTLVWLFWTSSVSQETRQH